MTRWKSLKDAVIETERLQASLLNITEAATGRREDLPEATVIATIKVMSLRITQLNSLIVVDDRGDPVTQARYEALLKELHQVRRASHVQLD